MRGTVFSEGEGTLGFVIIGLQRASTTSIQDYVHAHPGVCISMGGIACFESQAARTWRNKGSYSYSRARLLGPSNAIKYRFGAGRMRKEVRANIFARYVGGVLARLVPASIVDSNALLNDDSRAVLRTYFAADRERLMKSFPELVDW